jgi:endonuclease/exonuclease/phosphatase family metal-dependent hydrolase
MARRPTLRVLSWNIRGNTGLSDLRMHRLIDALASEPADIIMLQELSAGGGLPERLRNLFLRELKFEGWHFSGRGMRGKKYGNVIASRFPVRVAARRPRPDAPWPQLLARATVKTPIGEIDTISVHMPNGAGNGWKKIDTFEALGSILADEYMTPLIVGGDFNEPEGVGAANAVISAGADGDGIVRGHWRDRRRRRHPNSRWQSAVERILGPTSILEHAWLAKNRGVFETTHVVRGKKCFFDHVLVSRDHFEVTDAGFHHAWRRKRNWTRLSDHSAAWAVGRLLRPPIHGRRSRRALVEHELQRTTGE